MQRQSYTGRSSCDDKGRDWSPAAMSQELQRIPENHRKEGKEDFPKGFRGTMPCGHLHFELLASRTGPQ